MAYRMLEAMGSAPIPSASGEYLGHAPTFSIDRDQFDKVVDKITRGLYFHVYGRRVPPERTSEVILSPSRETFGQEAVQIVLAAGASGKIGQVFEYRIGRPQEPPGVAMAVMLFFGTIAVISSLLRPEAVAAYRRSRSEGSRRTRG